MGLANLFGTSDHEMIDIHVGDSSDDNWVALTMVIFINGVDSRDESFLRDLRVSTTPFSAISVLPFLESRKEGVSILK